jgi:hypothetical protein
VTLLYCIYEDHIIVLKTKETLNCDTKLRTMNTTISFFFVVYLLINTNGQCGQRKAICRLLNFSFSRAFRLALGPLQPHYNRHKWGSFHGGGIKQ